MKRVLTCVYGALTVATVLYVASAAASVREVVAESCRGVLDGAKFPELLPELVVWNRFADELAQLPTRVRNGKPLPEALTRGVAEISALTTGDRSRDHAQVIRTRNAVIRELRPKDLAQLDQDLEEQRARTEFELPVTGVLSPADADGRRRCQVIVKGSEHPELIPESYFWEAYFVVKAKAADGIFDEQDKLPPDFVKAQQRHHLPIPASDVNLVFRRARQVVALLSDVQGTSDHDVELRQRRARIVRNARQTLLRELSPASWVAVEADASWLQRSTTFNFPTR